MQHVIGTIFRGNNIEVFDDDTPGKESYSLFGLHSAIAEGRRRMDQSSDIAKINIYELFDGVRKASPQGMYGLIYNRNKQNRCGVLNQIIFRAFDSFERQVPNFL